MLRIDGERHSKMITSLSTILNRSASVDEVKDGLVKLADLISEADFQNINQQKFVEEKSDGKKHKIRALTDSDVMLINTLLPWSSFFIDDQSRVNGNFYNQKKRSTTEKLTDKRVQRLAALSDDASTQHVVEYGCFEGNHTVELCRHFGDVTALDGRVENSLKTLVRCWLLGEQPNVECLNLEIAETLPQSDSTCHIGVLYHLQNAPHHLVDVLKATKDVVLLDSQVASDAQLNDTYDLDGEAISVYRYREKDIAFSPFAGMLPEAVWLTPETIKHIGEANGFGVVEQQVLQERNGLRGRFYLKRLKE